MAVIVANCPRCGARSITFDVLAQAYQRENDGWQGEYELFCVCRHCKTGTIFHVSINSIEFARILTNGDD
jgi:hypothetical protein